MLHETKPYHPSVIKVIVAFAAIYIIWGSTYAAIAVAVRDIPPFLMLGARFFIAGILLAVYCIMKKYPLPSANLVLKNSFTGILMLYCGTGAVAWVEQYITSGLTAIIIAVAPLWYVILDRHLWSYHFKNRRIIAGLIIGLAGVIILFSDKTTFNFTDDKRSFIIVGVMLCSNILWVAGALFTKYKIREGLPFVNATLQMMAAGIALFITGLFTSEHHRLAAGSISLHSVYAVAYLIIFGSLVAYVAYIWLLTIRPPSMVGTYALVNPLVAVFFGWMVADEAIKLMQLAGLTVILFGVALVLFTKKVGNKIFSGGKYF